MIIFRGFGILVVLAVVFLVAVSMLVEPDGALAGGLTAHPSFLWVTLGLVCVGLAAAGWYFNHKRRQPVLDPGTGKLRKPPSHTFFFIPLEYWAVIIPAFVLFVRQFSGAANADDRARLANPEVGDTYVLNFHKTMDNVAPEYEFGVLEVTELEDTGVVVRAGWPLFATSAEAVEAARAGATAAPQFFDEARSISLDELQSFWEQELLTEVLLPDETERGRDAELAHAEQAAEEVARFKATNQPVRDELNRSMVLTDTNLIRREKDSRGQPQELVVQLELVNTSDDEITSWFGTLYVFEPHTARVFYAHHLAGAHKGFVPLAVEETEWLLRRGEDIPSNAYLWEIKQGDTLLIVDEIVFASGRTLAIPYFGFPQVNYPAHAAVLNLVCGRMAKRQSPADPDLIGAMAYPHEWTKQGNQYEIFTEMLVAGDGEAVRKPLQCTGAYEEDSMLLGKVYLDGEVVHSPSTD